MGAAAIISVDEEVSIDKKFLRFLADVNKMFKGKYYLCAEPEVIGFMEISDAFVQGVLNAAGLIVSLRAIPTAVNQYAVDAASANSNSRLFQILSVFSAMGHKQCQIYENLGESWPKAIAKFKGRVDRDFSYAFLLVEGFVSLPADVLKDLLILFEVANNLQVDEKVDGEFVEFINSYFETRKDAFWDLLGERFNQRLALREERSERAKRTAKRDVVLKERSEVAEVELTEMASWRPGAVSSEPSSPVMATNGEIAMLSIDVENEAHRSVVDLLPVSGMPCISGVDDEKVDLDSYASTDARVGDVAELDDSFVASSRKSWLSKLVVPFRGLLGKGRPVSEGVAAEVQS